MNKPYGRIKIQENGDGRKMLGGGCETCPVIACATSTYRGSACASQRASYGLGDPMTNADHIRSMSDEELADLLYNFGMSNIVERGKTEIAMRADKYHIELWLRTPYKENSDE